MGRGFSFLLLLLLLWWQAPGSTLSLLRYRYDCGDYGMRLLAYPPRGRTVRFKVVGEWGGRAGANPLPRLSLGWHLLADPR